MTDSEVDNALALAIGWPRTYPCAQGICVHTGNSEDRVEIKGLWYYKLRLFSHRDWTVIGPIAERYGAFPEIGKHIVYTATSGHACFFGSNTPQSALALAVLGPRKLLPYSHPAHRL